VEFDEKSLSPTYRVLAGVPGKSSALVIARKSGLSKAVVDRAETYLAGGHTDVSALIQALSQKYEAADSLTRRLKEEERELDKKRKKTLAREAALKEREIEIAERAKKSESRFVSESRKALENLVRELREGEITREKTLGVKRFIAALDGEAARASAAVALQKEELVRMKEEAAKESALASGAVGGELREGRRVWLRRLKKEGVLVAEAKRGAKKSAAWVVQAGSVKITVPEEGLSLLPDAPPPSPSVVLDSAENAAPLPELRLLGMRQEPAIAALEKQLDLCAMSGFSRFAVIHGKGNGVLQEAVRDCLSRYPHVAEYYFARPEDGGSGKTYVVMKG
jgi:DNA mismatch repair protein MutS2